MLDAGYWMLVAGCLAPLNRGPFQGVQLGWMLDGPRFQGSEVQRFKGSKVQRFRVVFTAKAPQYHLPELRGRPQYHPPRLRRINLPELPR